MQMEFDVDNGSHTLEEYREYAESIPEDEWCIGSYSDGHGRRCWKGHLAVYSDALIQFLNLKQKYLPRVNMAEVNDGKGISMNFVERDTPKQRIIDMIDKMIEKRG